MSFKNCFFEDSNNNLIHYSNVKIEIKKALIMTIRAKVGEYLDSALQRF